MNRRFEVHEARTESILVLFQINKPIATLTAPTSNELNEIGIAWVDAESKRPTSFEMQSHDRRRYNSHTAWAGFERRRT